MTRDDLNNEYFDWMCHLVANKRYTKSLSYRRLLMKLHQLEFIYLMEMDENRAMDGIDLRYRFTYDTHYPGQMVEDAIGNRPCSILEMMIALAMRCEENIMYDESYGDRTSKWFWSMISSLGLRSMDDSNYDPYYIEDVVTNFVYRNYAPNGRGGLFTIKKCTKDLRNIEIWYQMCWYLDSIEH